MMAETAPASSPEVARSGAFEPNLSRLEPSSNNASTDGQLNPFLTVEQVRNRNASNAAMNGTTEEAYLAHADTGKSRRSSSRGPRIIVPQKAINGGLEIKFEADHYNMKLFDLLTPYEYTDAITKVNEAIKPARSNSVDTALLVTGPLILPLGVWGIRHSQQVKKRKKYLFRAIATFNEQYPHLYMRWNKQPSSSLSIERRIEEIHGPPPFLPPNTSANAQAFDA